MEADRVDPTDLPFCRYVRVTSGSRVGSLLGDRKNALCAFRTKSAASFFSGGEKAVGSTFPYHKKRQV